MVPSNRMDRIDWFVDIGYKVLGVSIAMRPSDPWLVTLKRKLKDGILLLSVQRDGSYREVDYSPESDS